jgi:hypothetical protein
MFSECLCINSQLGKDPSKASDDHCEHGRRGGRIKSIAFVVRASEVKKILTHVELPTESPRVHPARGPRQSDMGSVAAVVCACG